VPDALADWDLTLADDGHVLRYQFDRHAERTGIASLMRELADLHIAYKDLSTRQSSLEDIFVELIHNRRTAA
jgi:ABC-2 type transport system ATP-binding protein